MHPRDSRIYVAPSVRGFELLAGKPAFFESVWGVLTVYDVFVGFLESFATLCACVRI